MALELRLCELAPKNTSCFIHCLLSSRCEGWSTQLVSPLPQIPGLEARKIQTLAEVEISEFCQSVIQARQDDGLVPRVPVFSDVRSFSAGQLEVAPEAMTAGFPCTVSCHRIDTVAFGFCVLELKLLPCAPRALANLV